jgi:hypothetical protein
MVSQRHALQGMGTTLGDKSHKEIDPRFTKETFSQRKGRTGGRASLALIEPP